MHIILIFLSLLSFTQSDSIENGWNCIRPLRTERTTVEKKFGRSRVDDNGYHMYETADAFIEVNYATKACAPDRLERGIYSVPEGTVLGYRVMLKDDVELSKVRFDRDSYALDKSGDKMNYSALINRKLGVAIVIRIERHIEIVEQIRYFPSEKDSKEFICNEKVS